MLNSIINFSVKNKLIVFLGTISLIIFGIYEVGKLPIDAVPDITNNQVLVISSAPSYSALDIERMVTVPIEQANINITGIKELRSFSRFGLSLVTLVFNDEVDVYWARQQVLERLQKIQIPKEICVPELGPVSTGLGEIYQYVLRTKKGFENKFNNTDLRSIQDWFIRKELLQVNGVADVNSIGGNVKQYEIAIDQGQLKNYKLSITDVFNAVENNNQNAGGAYIEKQSSALFILTNGLLKSIQDIENIAVKNMPNGVPLFIKDIAKVQMSKALRFGAMCYNDDGEISGGIVMMLKGANSNEVIKNIKLKIRDIQKSLPDGLLLEPFLDRTKMVNNAISTVTTNLLEGALIVVFILVVFLGNARSSLLVASIIPLAMLFAVVMMNVFGVSGNLMSLGALDFGLIIDGAVIIVEAVMHHLTFNKSTNSLLKLKQNDMDKVAMQVSKKMMKSAVFGQAVIFVVYVPIFALQGIEGKMFTPMVQTISFALIGAFILSLTYIPMMSALVLNKNVKTRLNFSDKMMARLAFFYNAILRKALLMPQKIIAFVFLLFCFSIYVLMGLGGEFIPVLEEGDLAIDTRILTGSNLNSSIEYTQQAAHLLLNSYPEIQKIVTKIGSGEVPTDPMPMEAADMMVILKDKNEWVSATTFPELTEKMKATLNDIPGISVGFQFPVQMRFNELMTGTKQDVSCKIFGDNLDTLAAQAQTLSDIIKQIEGAKDIYVEAIAGMPQIVIAYNRSTMAQYGISIKALNEIVNTSFAGKSAGKIYEGERKFDIVIRIDKTQKNNLEDVKNLLIPVNNSLQIPLWHLANITMQDGPNQVQREATKRRIIVGFNVRNRDVQSLVEDLQKKVNKQIKLPAGYRIQFGGTFENLNAAKKRLAITVPLALFFIFVLLYFAFMSIRYALLIYSAIPLSAIGGILFLQLRGMPFSISAGVGFIALFGVAVLNGIVLVAEFNRLKKENNDDILKLVCNGAVQRLRPILMTACVASLGFLPMAFSHGAGAEVQKPLATVVIGGLLFSTLLTIFIIPILYIMLEKKRELKFTKARIFDL